MTKDTIKNMAASVSARLNQYAKSHNLNLGDVQQYYAMERALFRISQSQYREQLVLKGGLMLFVFQGPLTRATKDIDLLAHVNNDPENLKKIIQECLSIAVLDDGLQIFPVTVKTEEIKKDSEYLGVRITFNGLMDRNRRVIQIDCGFGDIVYPHPLEIEFPQILNIGNPKLLGYTAESIIAEKYQAMVELSLANTRLKDFYDIWWFANAMDFDGHLMKYFRPYKIFFCRQHKH
jgi:predicted nucleotidyltransferase component of viral defense system